MERQNRILVVDDDQFTLRSTAQVLGSESYQVVTAAGGSEAIGLLRQDSFDLVLTDLRMPEVDGLEVLRWAREIAPRAVVLILTGYASVASAVEALRQGAYDYLVKPYAVDELKLKIERGLERVLLAEERQRAEEELRHHHEELAALNTIAAAVSQSLDLKERLTAALTETLAVLNADGGSICLSDKTTQALAPAVHHGLSQDVLRETTGFKIGGGLSGWAAESGEALVIADLAADPRNISPAAAREGWLSYAGVPIRSKGRVVGVMTLVTRQRGHFRRDHLGLLTHIGNQIGVAAENARLFEETERLKAFNESIVQGVAEAILIEDAQGLFTFANPAAETMLGYTHEELIGRHWTTIMPEEQVGKVRQELVKRSRRAERHYETALLSKEGQVIPVIVGARPLFEGGELAGVLSAFTDITERKLVEQQLAHMATHDPLTDVPNRRGFFELAEQQLKVADRRKNGSVLLFADLDHLKHINDALGHPEGDRALIEVANILRETFRESDIIARIGGDEFAVLAVETDEVSAETLATRLRYNLEAHNARGDRPYKLSLSIGLAHYAPEHPCSIDELLAQADRAMYEQKQDHQ